MPVSTPPPSINSDLARVLELVQTAHQTPFKDVDANLDKLNDAKQLLEKISDELGIDGADSK